MTPDKPMAKQPATQPAYVTILRWCDLTGMGKTSTYAAMKQGRLPFIKEGRRTLIDYPVGVAMLAKQAAGPAQQKLLP